VDVLVDAPLDLGGGRARGITRRSQPRVKTAPAAPRSRQVTYGPRTNPTSPNQLTGYAAALPDDRNAAGDTI